MNKSTIKKIAEERPSMRFAVPAYLQETIANLGAKNLDVLAVYRKYDYGRFEVELVPLWHDVENVGFKLNIDGKKILYATDTCKLDHIEAKEYDYYFLEGNWDEGIVEDIIAEKEMNGIYSHERKAKENHMSVQATMDFIASNAGAKSKYILLHQSKNLKEEVI